MTTLEVKFKSNRVIEEIADTRNVDIVAFKNL